MRLAPLFGLAALAALAPAQRLSSVYNRDSGEAFALKGVESKTIVKGPIAKTTTVYTFANPHKKLTEASFNFSQPWGSALDGFAYWYKNEYVPGMLMDKDQAWFIYTAITSRDRDPGIMEQTSSNSYHAQIYPLAIGYDLRIELQSVEFMNARPDRFVIAAPSWPHGEASFESVPFKWSVDPMEGGLIKMIGNDHEGQVRDLYAVDAPVDLNTANLDVRLLGQKGVDGLTYVAGTVRTHKPTGMNTQWESGSTNYKVSGLDEVFIWPAEDTEYAFHFAGYMKSIRPVLVQGDGTRNEVFLTDIGKGDWTSKLYAQAKLTYGDMDDKQEILAFSLKHQVPSSYTALLAVPKEEWKLFEEKKKEWQAEQRRKQREQDRQRSRTPADAPMNWDNSFGGDPVIRVQEKKAIRSDAVLPDGRVLTMKPLPDGWWTVNFEIPATAPEGEYKVKIRFYSATKFLREQIISYTVDRTAPTGKLTVKVEKQQVFITVVAEPGLHEVSLQLADGRILKFKEAKPSHYELVLAKKDAGQKAAVVLKDDASNKAVIPCTWPALR